MRVTSTRKHVVVAVSVSVHAALFALLLRASPETPAFTEVGAISVSLLPGTALAATAPPTPPASATAPPDTAKAPVETLVPQLTDVVPQYVDMEAPEPQVAERDPLSDPVALSVATAAASASGEVCHLGQWLQQALQSDSTVLAALPTIPRPARSVANAVMLWDGEWVATRGPSGAGIVAVRAALISGIRAAPPTCQDQLIRGPELLTLTEDAGSTILAVGSGEWRWSDLLAPRHQVAEEIGRTPIR